MELDQTISVRTAQTSDGSQLSAMLNGIIEIGGTTAFQKPFDATDFEEEFLKGLGHIC